MTSLDRRFDHRIPLETYLTSYVNDRPVRAFTTDISETGLYLCSLPHNPLPPLQPVGLELALPGINETLWIAGELRRDALDDYFYGSGIHFTAMASRHARILREYCYKARRRRLFARS